MEEILRKENKAIKKKTLGSRENEHMKTGECNAEELYVNEVGRKKMDDELQSLASKYKEMGKRIRGSSTMEQLLHKTDLPHSNKIMVVPPLPKF